MLIHNTLQYKAWADRRALDAVAQLDPLAQHEALAFARQQLNHMVRVEEIFRARLLGEAAPPPMTVPTPIPAPAR